MNRKIFDLQPIPIDVSGHCVFYVIEVFHEPIFVTDLEGRIKAFSAVEQAQTEADDCQNGFVIAIPI